MGDPVLDINNDPLSTEGLENIFDLAPVTCAEVTGTEPVPEPVTHAKEPAPTCAEGVPIEEAALLIGTSVNALKKRLRKGTLRGNKVESKHGEKWLVDASELVGCLAPVTCAEVTGAEPVTTAKEPVTPDSQPVLTSADNDNRLVAIIENQAHQLKAAGDVIMYLRSQIEEKETQLKLLTDSQHKRHWWTSFCSWFLGRTTELP